eukprot:GHUV01026097.1.p1 GENE.GHUV01026097.1~~GHUV01026097.1.p1  ORF type:complete len:534 (+),score=88.75 GHUV01026097.1:238-1839(+)
MADGNPRLKEYAAEVHSVKSDIALLKAKFYERQKQRAKLRDASKLLAELGQVIDWRNPVETDALKELQSIVATELLDPASTLPISADALHKKILCSNQSAAYRRCMSALHHPDLSRLLYFLAIDNHLLTAELLDLNGNNTLVITAMDRSALAGFARVQDPLAGLNGNAAGAMQHTYEGFEGYNSRGKRVRTEAGTEDLDSLLQVKTARERDRLEKGEELLELLDLKTARQQEQFQQYQTGGAAVREHCPCLTKEACRRARGQQYACHRLHQRKILYPWTDESLGNCSYLDTCRDVRRCKFVHYELDPEPEGDVLQQQQAGQQGQAGVMVPKYLQALQEPQWIRCDVRDFRFDILGKFGVIMTDPPWEIRQDLPYGTMSDEEMLNMPIADLQDDGVIFMWVVTRALELGREALAKWGYRRVDELIWVKTNSLQRLITPVSGRTGHFLNHSKEHCLVGYKGNPQLNRYVDCDVLVSEVRETSRKPDEMYPLLERLSPGTRKLEIFARQHNVRPGWVSLGNQLDGVYITDPEMLQR